MDNIDKALEENKTCAVAKDANGNILYNNDGTVKPMYYYYKSTKYQFKGGDAMYEDQTMMVVSTSMMSFILAIAIRKSAVVGV